MVKKTIYCFIFFLQIYLTSLQGKEYFAKEPEPVGAEPREKNNGARAAWEKNQEPEPLIKKVFYG